MEIKNICVLASASGPCLELNELEISLLNFCGFARVLLFQVNPAKSKTLCQRGFDRQLRRILSQSSKELYGLGWGRIALAREIFASTDLFRAKRCSGESMN